MNMPPHERINHAFKGIELEDELYRAITKTVNKVHRAHIEVFYNTIADALEEQSLDRLLYLCRTGRPYPDAKP